MSIDDLFEYLSSNPDVTDAQVEAAIDRVSDKNERELANVSAWEFLASLRQDDVVN